MLALARLCVGIRHQVTGNAGDAAVFYGEALETFYQADNVFWPGQVLQNLARLRLEEETILARWKERRGARNRP